MSDFTTGELLQPTSPMSVETEPSVVEPRGVNSDVVATRHLRIVLESITADKNLTEEERKKKIANFGAVLMASAETKAPLKHDKKPEPQTTTEKESITPVPQVSSPPTPLPPPQSKENDRMELIRAAVLASEERRKKAISSSKIDEPVPLIVETPPAAEAAAAAATAKAAPPETEYVPQQPQKSAPVPKPEIKKTNSSASVIPMATITVQQPKPYYQKKKKKKGWLVRKLTGRKYRDEERGDFEEREHVDMMSERDDQSEILSDTDVGSERYDGGIVLPVNDGGIMNTGSNVSEDSDRSIGTFEQDYINHIMQDQENNLNALSEGTFEQDASDGNGLNALSEGTFEQDARAIQTETGPRTSSVFVPEQVPQQVVGDMPNLSETTFEQDAMDAERGNDEEFGTAGSEMSNGSFGSETTFERDMRRQAAASKHQNPTAPQIAEAPSLESVTTFEKEARGRMAVAAKSREFPQPQFNDYADPQSDGVESDCSDNFRQDISQDMRPAEPEPYIEWETTAAPYPLPKISELQMQLSPEKISKRSLGSRLLSKFTCHCA